MQVLILGKNCKLSQNKQSIRNIKKKYNKTVMLSASKLNSIENKISEALINNEISHEDLMTIINKDKKYQ